jgi:hypothetical protein
MIHPKYNECHIIVMGVDVLKAISMVTCIYILDGIFVYQFVIINV